MARIICISKYPPLEGGIAAKTYWLCRALAERGHVVHVVTDEEDIDADYCSPSYQDQFATNNLHIHRPQKNIPWHIPNDSHRSLALLNSTLEIFDRYGADVIDTGYMIPYGIVGYLAGQITGAPFLLRHGGSDLNKFKDAGIWDNLITKAVTSAAAIITNKKNYKEFSGSSKRVFSIPPYVPDPAFFKPPTVGEKKKPILALVGKANYYWQHKGWHKVIDIMKGLRDHFHFQIITQGTGLKEFKNYAEDRLGSSVEWKEFVHPAEMPQLLQSLNGIFVLQNDLPFPVFSNLVLEALFSDVTVITDNPDMVHSLKEYDVHLSDEHYPYLSISSNKPNEAANVIISNFEKSIHSDIGIKIKESLYASYLIRNEEALGSCKTSLT